MDGNNCPNGVASCDRPFRYSPLIEVDSRVTAAAPLFYGMLLVSRIGAGDMLPTTTHDRGQHQASGLCHNASRRLHRRRARQQRSFHWRQRNRRHRRTGDLGFRHLFARRVPHRHDGSDLGRSAGYPRGSVESQGALYPDHTGNTVTVPVPFASAVLVTAH